VGFDFEDATQSPSSLLFVRCIFGWLVFPRFIAARRENVGKKKITLKRRSGQRREAQAGRDPGIGKEVGVHRLRGGAGGSPSSGLEWGSVF